MDYRQFKIIEQYFRLGELIEKNHKKLSSLAKIKHGYLSLGDLKIIQEELSSFGFDSSDHVELNELYTSIMDEIKEFNEARKELKEMCLEINVDIDKIVCEKQYHENILTNTYSH
ncbi:hypothetical protein [Pallidibacillus pasinlerensis]|uniref:Uncharacterized protein n=1 Tax=Pallidibacillus pasinlerensis TaxID=2703818 RepID=A0ABX0A6R5_9BACI|nr:hypothetical protein [Pallidibacillus pasinlerensis]NCU19115.1 hypothetical protein [Pallidibacillus pasinlerensis]